MEITQELIESIFLRASGETLLCQHSTANKVILELDRNKKVIIRVENVDERRGDLFIHPEGLTEAKEVIALELITIFNTKKEKEERRKKFLEAKKVFDELKNEFETQPHTKYSIEEEVAYLKKDNPDLFGR
jgi:hypothetical protein